MAVAVLLTRGLMAFVDDEDADVVLARKWCTHLAAGGHTYAVSALGGRSISLHRFLLQPPPRFVVDHINRDGLDNRRCNLRVVTQSQNLANRKRSPTKWGFKGVGFSETSKNKYYGVVTIAGRRAFTTRCETPEQAARAWDALMLEHYDAQFIDLNFPAEAAA